MEKSKIVSLVVNFSMVLFVVSLALPAIVYSVGASGPVETMFGLSALVSGTFLLLAAIMGVGPGIASLAWLSNLFYLVTIISLREKGGVGAQVCECSACFNAVCVPLGYMDGK